MTPGLVRFMKGYGDVEGGYAVPGVQVGPTVRVEILESVAEQQRGLMDRVSLAKDEGALFWFLDRRVRVFWMRRTILPLDLIFIDRDQVVGVLTLAPHDETPRGIDRPSTSVLEVNGGFAGHYGVTVGQRVTITRT